MIYYLEKEILILVKTYPTLSSKYVELVCTAGIDKDGNWYRIYPIPFRYLNEDKKYKKYQIIKASIAKNENDHRIDSYSPKYIFKNNIQEPDLNIIRYIDTKNNWEERKKWIEKTRIYNSYEKLKEEFNKNSKNSLSLATFKPKRILDLKIEPVERYWEERKIQALKNIKEQRNFFNFNNDINTLLKTTKKLPYKFSYIYEDYNDKKMTGMIVDWEIGQLYWNCLRGCQSEKEANEKVKAKYLKEFSKKDITLFLGTTKKEHRFGTFIIIGVFYPKKD